VSSSLIDGGLPNELGGSPIHADFRNILQIMEHLEKQSSDQTQTLLQVLQQFYEEVPQDYVKAIEGLIWFIHRGAVPDTDQPRTPSKRKAYDFTQDANLIFSAFFATYGIDLADIAFLHWWKFLALFESLPEDALIRKVMYWRSCDVSRLSKEEKKHVLEMRKHFALKGSEQAPQTIEEVNQSTRDYYERRIARVQERQK